MDAFLADAMLAPPGADALFSERLIRLPRIPLAYAPPDAMPEVTPLPATANGFVTFGYFGRTERLNDAVIAAWARILRDVPGARLMLNSLPFREPAFRDLIAARFAAHGVDRDRLELIATSPQPATWAAYGGIDIALDPFPHNAGTTTIEALWQGVPVVSLAGRPSVGRFGAMILHAVGMDDWVSADTDGYVACALAAATDLRQACTGACHAAPACRRFAAVRCGGIGAAGRSRLSRAVRRMLSIASSARISRLADIEDSQRGSRIVIEDDVVIDAFVKIKPAGGSGDVVIGRGTVINAGCVLYTGNGIRIGRNVLIAANCTLAPTNHEFGDPDRPIRAQGFQPSRGGIVIGDDVWIGANCVLLDGTTIGSGSVIGAASLLRGTLPPYCLAHGTPAVVHGWRGSQR